MSGEAAQVSLSFSTKLLEDRYRLKAENEGPFIFPTTAKRDELSLFLNSILELDDDAVQFDFKVEDVLLRTSLQEYLDASDTASELELSIEYFIRWQSHEPDALGEAPTAILQLLKVPINETDHKLVVLCARGNVLVRELEDETKATSHRMTSDTPLALLTPPNPQPTHTLGAVTTAGTLYSFNPLAASNAFKTVGRVRTNAALSAVTRNADGSYLAFGTVDGDILLCRAVEYWASSSSASSPAKRTRDSTEPIVPSLPITQSISRAHEGSVTALHFLETSADQSKFAIVSTGEDGAIRIWDYIDGSKITGFDSTKAIASLTVGKSVGPFTTLATGHADGKVRVWKLQDLTDTNATLTLASTYPAHSKLVNACQWNVENKSVLASAANDQNVCVIDASTQKIPLTMQTVPANEKRRSEYPTTPTALCWWSERTLVVGTTQNSILRYRY